MLTFAERDTPQWHAAWHGLYETLKSHGLSADDVGGEAWQYMGTTPTHHEFRHRNEASTQRRVYVRAPLNGEAAGADGITICPEPQVVHIAPPPPVQPAPAPRQRRARWVPEENYSGAFDGHSVISDADPGL